MIPTNLQNIIDTITLTTDDVDVYKISSRWTDAVNDFDTYYNEYQKMLEQYIEYKKTKEYRESGGTSGYYDENLT